MAEEINEPKNIQGKPQATESVKHVHLERKRPKLSKFDDENPKNAKDKSSEAGKKHHSQNSNRGKKSAQHNHAGKRDPNALTIWCLMMLALCSPMAIIQVLT